MDGCIYISVYICETSYKMNECMYACNNYMHFSLSFNSLIVSRNFITLSQSLRNLFGFNFFFFF